MKKHRIKIPGKLPLNAYEYGNILKFQFHKIPSADVSSLANRKKNSIIL